MVKPIININEVKMLVAKLRKINEIDLQNAIFIENNVEIAIDEKIINDFKMTGLNNQDFIATNFYEHGWDE